MEKIKYLQAVLLLFFLPLGHISATGTVKIEQGDVVELVMDGQKQDFSGFRIQVFSGKATERVKAERIKAEVEQRFNAKAYINYTSNTFRVQVGDFISKLDAIPLKYKLKKRYASCYIVKVKKIQLISDVSDSSDAEIEVEVPPLL